MLNIYYIWTKLPNKSGVLKRKFRRFVMTYTKEYKESIQKYINSLAEKENKSMSNTTNFEKVLGKKNANMGEAIVNVRADLGKSLKELLVDAYDKFSRWMETSQSILEELKSAKESIEAIEELDNTMVELTKVSNETT